MIEAIKRGEKDAENVSRDVESACISLFFIENGVIASRPATEQEVKDFIRGFVTKIDGETVTIEVPKIEEFEQYRTLVKAVEQLGMEILEEKGENKPEGGFSLKLVAKTKEVFSPE